MLGILAFGFLNPWLLPVGCFVGIVIGYWYDALGAVLLNAWQGRVEAFDAWSSRYRQSTHLRGETFKSSFAIFTSRQFQIKALVILAVITALVPYLIVSTYAVRGVYGLLSWTSWSWGHRIGITFVFGIFTVGLGLFSIGADRPDRVNHGPAYRGMIRQRARQFLTRGRLNFYLWFVLTVFRRQVTMTIIVLTAITSMLTLAIVLGVIAFLPLLALRIPSGEYTRSAPAPNTG